VTQRLYVFRYSSCMMVQRNIHFHTFKIYNSSHRLILNLRTYRTASLSHELLLIIAFGELLIKKFMLVSYRKMVVQECNTENIRTQQRGVHAKVDEQ
jgi:hypothetical protein